MLAGYSRGVTGLCSPLRDGEYCWCKTCPGVPTALLFVMLLQLFEASLPNFSKVGCQSVLPWVVSLPVGDMAVCWSGSCPRAGCSANLALAVPPSQTHQSQTSIIYSSCESWKRFSDLHHRASTGSVLNRDVLSFLGFKQFPKINPLLFTSIVFFLVLNADK